MIPTTTAVDFDPFAGPVIDQAFPSTPSQREIWSAVMLGDDASRAFNESVTLSLDGTLDVSKLQQAVRTLISRHQSLRATFSTDGLTMLVANVGDFDVPVVPVDGVKGLKALQRAEVEHVFSLEKGPLVRARIAALSPTSHVLILTAHHIVFDGWSMGVCVKELAALYDGATLPPAPTFDAYARGEAARPSSPEFGKAVEYWQKRFTGSAPVLELPLDRPRPPSRTFASMREDHVLPADLVAQVKKVGAKHGASFFATMLAGFSALLHRLSGQDDVVVGIPAAGQNFTRTDGLVGHCVNTLPVRAFVEGQQPFSALLKQTRTAMLDATDHQVVAFGALLERLKLPRDPSRLPLVSVLFNVDQTVTTSGVGFTGLTTRVATNPRAFESFEIFINASESPAGMVLETQFNTDLFSADTMKRWLSAFEVLLRAIVETPDGAVARLPILPASERAQLEKWNASTKRPFPRELNVAQLIEQQVDRTPNSLSLQSGERAGVSLTYAELDARANQLANRLRTLGVKAETLVGLFMDRSPDMVVALLGILKAGGAYVPLDPAFPKDRLAFMVEDAKLQVIVTTTKLIADLPANNAQIVDVTSVGNEPQTRPTHLAGPKNVAYVIYTSGSTGKPKGVEVPHLAVVNFLTSMKAEPGLTANDTLVAVTTLSFDIAVLELQLPLTVGAKVVIATREISTDGAQLKALIETNNATAMQATPSTWRLLLTAGWTGGPHFKALVGGEAVPRDLANELCRRTASAWNMYGPTETTVWSTCARFEAPVGRVSIGTPIANTTAWVLDAALNPVPVGVPGELHLGGDGVTRGYLHRPELTAERFIDDPFAPGQKLYKTGDVARVLPDGSLEYLRRNDNQVKVRGYRIELGEIEAVLARHPALKQAAVVVREDRPGDVRLVAYLIPNASLPPDAELRAHVKAALPDYMVPQHFVSLPAFPLTPNNKIDRKALPAPQLDTTPEAIVAPRNDVEQKIHAIWADVLGREKLSVHDDFFALGGHSLLAAQVMTRLNRELGTGLSMRKLFEAPTIAGLAELAKGPQTQPAVARIPHRTFERTAPCSLMQTRMWFLEQMQPGTAVNNLPSAFRFKGKLDHAALKKSLNAIIARQPSMRTYFELEDGAPVQRVMPALELDLVPTDLSAMPVAQRDVELMTQLKAAANEAIELTHFPLIRARYFILSSNESVLFYMPHHAIWDGWSFDIFLDELSKHYEAFTTGKTPDVASLPITYQDFAAWHREWLVGAELERQSAYWRQQLGGELKDLDFPTDRPRGANFSYRGATEPFNLTKDEIAALTTLARGSHATLYMVLLAAFKALLHRYTGHEDLLVGTPIRGRTQPEVENLIGFFVNALVLRTKPTAKKSFREFLGDVRTTVLDAFSHQDMPFELLLRELNVRRDMSRTPIYQAFFTFQDVSNRGSSLGEVPYGQIHVHAAATQTDLSFWVKETGNGMVGGIDYSTDLFERSTIVRFLDHLRQLLRAVVADPSQELGRIEILTQGERDAFAQWNQTKLDFPRELGVHQLIEAQVDRSPDAIALEFGDEKLTYRQLDERANAVAATLRREGIKPGDLVGLCLERSPQMVATFLGILKAGAAYVPLDPAFPRDRLAFMVTDSKMPALVTTPELHAELSLPAPKIITTLDATTTRPPQLAHGPLAYVIYTSGSTGKPKGVQVPHLAVVNFLTTMQRSPGITSSDRLLAVTTLSFDIAVLELQLPLTVGAKVVLAGRDAVADGEALKTLIDRHDVTVMQATPSTWRLLFGAGFEGGKKFRALVGGEAVPLDLAQQLVKFAGGGVWNMYGPTETTVWSTTYEFPADVKQVLIGKPIGNTTCFVWDALGQQVPIGVPGELLIGGDGVTHGYFGRPELTAEKFIDSPEGKLYRTGDVARFRADGNLEYQRRNDNQVKVRGYRIELGEIETALSEHPTVKQAVVIVREDKPGDQRLVGYLIMKPGEDAQENELKKQLRARLPDYMVPQHFVTLEALPLTPNGKIDRRALPAPTALARDVDDWVPPRTDVEKLVAEVWMGALKIDKVGLHDNFFNLGGHSLLSLSVLSQLEAKTGTRLSPRMLLLNTLEQVAAALPPRAPSARPSAPRPSTPRPPPAPPPPREERGLVSTLVGGVLSRLKKGRDK
ncbi:MAG: amino acid adenylation domain-containing protein [Myxococcaceae bacterium]